MADRQDLTQEDPRTLGPYELLGRLGEGAQGLVYLARDPGGTQVAVKLLRMHLSQNAASRERFLREVDAAKRVPSFCTAKLLDADLADSQPYIVSEYIAGPSLAAVVRSEGPRGGTALERIAVNTATALAGIHQAGVVHRDFKAANVLLGPDGPVVIDFGIAKALDAADAGRDLTMPGQTAGTPGYMAPEQFEAGQTGPEADVFAWGATMAFAATGSLPFGAGPVSNVIYRMFNEPPQLDGLASPLRDLVAACLRPEPGTRPAARDIVDTLLGHQGTAAVTAAQPDKTPSLDGDATPGLDGTPPLSMGMDGTGTGTGFGFGPQTGTGTGIGGTGALRGDPIRAVQMRQASPGFDFDQHERAEARATPRRASRMPKGSTITAAAALAVVVAGAAGYAIWGKSAGVARARPMANATARSGATPRAAHPAAKAKAGTKAASQGGAAQANSGGAQAETGTGTTGEGTVPGQVSDGQPAQGGSAQQGAQQGAQQPPAPAGGTAPTASAPRPASAKPNPYSASQVCGSGYSVIDSHALSGGTVYLLYNSSSGRNCVATLRSMVSGAISMSATLKVQGGSSSGDSGRYTYYAGPVALAAKSTCVEWGGSIASSSWTSGWSHCG